MFSIISAIGVPGGDLTAALVLEHARENLHLVGLAPLRREARLAGLALVEKELNLFRRQGNARRAAVDDRAERRPVALAKSGDAEEVAETIVGHGGVAPLEGSAFVRRGREGVKRTTRNPPIVAAARRRY